MTTRKGWEGKIEIETSEPDQNNPLTYVTDFRLSQDQGAEGVWELGTRSLKEIKEGNVRVTGSITRNYDPTWTGGTGGTQTFATLGIGSTTAALTSYYMSIYPAGYASAGLLKLNLSAVKFNTYNFSVTQDGFATESIDFVADAVQSDVTV